MIHLVNNSRLLIESIVAANVLVPLAIELLARYGRAFEHIAEFPFRRGARGGDCFENAYQLAIARGLHYCEGYAVSGALVVPLAHAWCVDDGGSVYDPTWADGGHYFGAQIRMAGADQIAALTGRRSVFQSLHQLRLKPETVRLLVMDAIVVPA